MTAVALLGDTATSAAIATVVATGITSFTGWAIARSARRSSERGQEQTSRTDLEKEAFQRAKGFYVDTIDRQAAEMERQARELERQDRELEECRRVEARLRRDQEALRLSEARSQRRVEELSARVEELAAELGTAQAALRQQRGGAS